MRSAAARSMFNIFPRRGSIAWYLRSRPCLALPAAESPSTIKISDSIGSRLAQSASLPGKTVDVNNVFRRTISRAARAAAAAACASLALLHMESNISTRHSNNFVKSDPNSESTAIRTSGLPNRPFVWPSNSGSDTETDTMAVNPSRMHSPGKFTFLSFNLPTFFDIWLIVRVKHARKPSTCDPPSFVRILLQNDSIDSVYISDDHRSAMDTLMGGLPFSGIYVPEHKIVRLSGVSNPATGSWIDVGFALKDAFFFEADAAPDFAIPPTIFPSKRGVLAQQSKSIYSANPPAW